MQRPSCTDRGLLRAEIHATPVKLAGKLAQAGIDLSEILSGRRLDQVQTGRVSLPTACGDDYRQPGPSRETLLAAIVCDALVCFVALARQKRKGANSRIRTPEP